MNNELITTHTAADLTAVPQPQNLTQINIGSSNNIQAIIGQQNINYINTPSASPIADPTRCNIFVLNGKNFSSSLSFSILKSRIYTANVQLSEVTSFPSLLINKNNGYKRCADPNQCFYYGSVTKIEDEGLSFRVFYQLRSLPPLYQSKLNDAASALGIQTIKGTDVLDQVGWRIYPINIKKALTDAGFNMEIY